MIGLKFLLEIIVLPMLVYDYMKIFYLNPNETISDFLTNPNTTYLSNEHINILQEIQLYSPNGEVVKFLNDKKTDLQVAITLSETNKRISVVFRGSESKSDWFYDLLILKKHLGDNIYVHTGFWEQLHINNNYQVIRDELNGLLNIYNNFQIIITGHSLGGALATLCGYELSLELNAQIIIISFASPRIGNNIFTKRFDNQHNLIHYRVSNNNDIVTALPMLNYKHCGVNIHLRENSYVIYTNYSYNKLWKFSLWKCHNIMDHDIDNYYKNLKNNLFKENNIIL